MRPVRGSMRYLGVLRGSGTLAGGDETIGPAEFDIDGFSTLPGDVAGSGEIRMAPADLDRAFGRSDLKLTTDDGLVLALRFSGKRLDPSEGAAHADIQSGLPPAAKWRR